MTTAIFLLGILLFPLGIGFLEMYKQLRDNGYIDNGLLCMSIITLVLSLSFITKSFTMEPNIKEETYGYFHED